MKNSMRLIAVILSVLLICAVAMLISAHRELTEAERMTTELTAKRQDAESKNTELLEKLKKLGTDEYIEEIARERLGLVKPDEIIFVVVQNSEP